MCGKIYHATDDKQFTNPVQDIHELRTHEMADGTQVKYLYIHGYFKGTDLKFSFHFPLKDKWQGRFFQYLSPFPGPDEEVASMQLKGEMDNIGFALYHGSCFVESNMASKAMFSTNEDGSIYYRSSACVAAYCKRVAKELYGNEKTYGYVFGGSGGGFKTMSCIESTDEWDGALAYVIGSPVALPNVLTVFAHGKRVLRHSIKRIVEALEPGADCDPHDFLSKEEAETYDEIIRMGFPPRMCYQMAEEGYGSLPVLLPGVKEMDPDYFTDFWTKDGYLGTANNSSALNDRIHMKTKVCSVGYFSDNGAEESIPLNGVDNAWKKMLADGANVYLELEEVPTGEDLYLDGIYITLLSGKAKDSRLLLGHIEGNKVVLGSSFGVSDLSEVIGKIEAGDEVLLDNSDFIAVQTYHRHQVPEDRSFTAWNQYRNPDGSDIYPQRPRVISYEFTGSSGSNQNGRPNGKLIVMNSLMDGDFPWQADWYRRLVEKENGENAKGIFRIYYNDNCPHGDRGEADGSLRVVSYLGMLDQALLDLANWTEEDICPADSTDYDLVENQIILNENIKDRAGLQPKVSVTADGSHSLKTTVGKAVSFVARIETPEMGGACTKVLWSFESENENLYESSDINKQSDHLFTAAAEHSFKNAGVYYVVTFAEANRNPNDPYTRLRNLSRIRVEVEKA